MLKSAKDIGGKGFSIVVWVTGMGFLPVAFSFIAFFTDPEAMSGSLVVDLCGKYIVMLGIAVGVYQAKSITAGLPGDRSWSAPKDSGVIPFDETKEK